MTELDTLVKRLEEAVLLSIDASVDGDRAEERSRKADLTVSRLESACLAIWRLEQ